MSAWQESSSRRRWGGNKFGGEIVADKGTKGKGDVVGVVSEAKDGSELVDAFGVFACEDATDDVADVVEVTVGETILGNSPIGSIVGETEFILTVA